MGGKYEVSYWDYKQGKVVSVMFTNNCIKAYLTLHKMAKEWPCVYLTVRED